MAHLSELLQAQLPSQPRLLILGSGAARLAYELHQYAGAGSVTVCLDSNPLLSLLAQKMTDGDQVSLTEFPLAPVDAQRIAVTQTLLGRQADPGFEVICADASTVPLADNSFDLVVTPWLIDVIDSGLPHLLDQIQRVLKIGGLWLNHGSLAFQGHPGQRLGAEEVVEIADSYGFTTQHSHDIELPYLHSPHSRQHRNELVHTLLASKINSPTRNQSPQQYWPDWLGDTSLAVPFTPAFKAQLTHVRIHGFIMGLIDGKRSINDMADVMEEQRLMPKAQARQALKGFIQTMVEEARHRDGAGALSIPDEA